MTLQDIREIIKKALESFYPEREIDTITHILVEFRLGLKRHEAGLKRQDPVSKSDEVWFKNAIRKLAAHTPVQHITGETEFCGLRLKVSPATLIPRPETEELVAWILEDYGDKRPRILDIGTGNGCIALALASQLPGAEITAIDHSLEALELARENARQLELEVNFLYYDLLENSANGDSRELWDPGPYDIMVSNPPYIPESDRKRMLPNVLEYEPAETLFVPDKDPLLFYRHIAGVAERFLREDGGLYLEIHEDYGPHTLLLLKSHGFFNPEIRQDINGKDRMVRALHTRK